MGNICKVVTPAGNNPDCTAVFGRLKQIIIVEAGTAFATASLATKATLVTAISSDLKAYVLKVKDYAPTTDEPEDQTSGDGQKLRVQEFPPSMDVYADLNPCDYRELLNTLKGGQYDIILIDKNGDIKVTYVDTNSYGFSAHVSATPSGIADPGNLHQSYKIALFFKDIEQFRQYQIISTSYATLTELFSAMPTGYGLTLVSYDGTTAVVSLSKRCGDLTAGFSTAADWVLYDTNESPVPTVTAVTDNTDGTYDLSVALADAYANIRLTSPIATPFVAVSSLLYIES